MKCRIEIFHHEFGSSIREYDQQSILIGRSAPGAAHHVDLNLDPDRRVSRNHGRFVFEGNSWWVEDLGSTHGIMLHQKRIAEKVRIVPGDRIQIADWLITLHYEVSFQDEVSLPTVTLETDAALLPRGTFNGNQGSAAGDYAGRFLNLIELSVSDTAGGQITNYLMNLAETLRENLPFVKGIDIIKVPEIEGTTRFEYILPPSSFPSTLSRTLAERVMKTRKALLLSDTNLEAPDSQSLHASMISAAMYVPLLASGYFEGILCISSTIAGAFQRTDLAFACTVAFLAATKLYEDRMRQEINVRERTLSSVRPHFPEKLWRLYISSGEALKKRQDMAEAVILYISMRGYRCMIEEKATWDIAEIMQDFQEQVVSVVHRLDGTTQFHSCDEIAAFFGAPEPDQEAPYKAVYSAWEIKRKLKFWHDIHRSYRMENIQVSMGIHRGTITHGFAGNPARLRYLAIGEPLNTAMYLARQAAPEQILLSTDLLGSVKGKVETGAPQEVEVPSRQAALCCVELLNVTV